MQSFINSAVLSFIICGITSLITDMFIGDPEWKIHPVAILGRYMDFLKRKLRTGRKKADLYFIGPLIIFLTSLPAVFFPIFTAFLIDGLILPLFTYNSLTDYYIIRSVLGGLIFGFMMKWSFAIKYLGDAVFKVAEPLEKGDIEKARKYLSYIVRRDTSRLDVYHIISACVEVIAESSADSCNGVFFFYGCGFVISLPLASLYGDIIVFSLPVIPVICAYLYRVINTADSIMGYKDSYHRYIGYIAAKSDDIANFIPVRLTFPLMLLSGKFYRLNIRNAIHVVGRDAGKTSSPNAGITMSTMAGLLGIRLEKIDAYRLGDNLREPSVKDIYTAYKVIRNTCILFALLCIFIPAVISGVFL